ncbi:hypothetical protein GP486_004445 [Trichoglossum hirsutum]|uniref:Ammonium transporter AmtB-like domain-containing protein n=1 Tax=Trichoglossum hirsutum TaxID=265104 RepID=A0A9P8LAU5_9PEZI|nr:hypothetical protein GP486_004445 [Trichoglossum hirsutum]
MSESPKMFFDVVPAFNFNVSVDPAEFGKNPNLYFEWYLLGYSLVFSSSSNNFWGSANSGTLHGVLANPAREKLGPRIPELVYTLYQGMFACFTASLVGGVVYKKHRALPFLIFIFIWSTLVYDPIARWSWNPQGWSALWGTLDFAGGTVVHIVAATTTAVYANFVKVHARIRKQILPVEDLNADETPSNIPYIVLGTTLLWFGWFGFNGGSALGANLRAVSACISTNIAACMGGVTGCFLDWYLEPYTVPPHVTEKPKRKFSIISFCNGVIAGLVTITPAAELVMNLFWDRSSTETVFKIVVDTDDIVDMELQAERVPSANGTVGGATGAENGESPEATGAVNPEGAIELHPLLSSRIRRA